METCEEADKFSFGWRLGPEAWCKKVKVCVYCFGADKDKALEPPGRSRKVAVGGPKVTRPAGILYP